LVTRTELEKRRDHAVCRRGTTWLQFRAGRCITCAIATDATPAQLLIQLRKHACTIGN
jgi:hypothetical protein